MSGKPSRGFDLLADVAARKDWLVLDTETTGIARDSELIEIAIIDAEGSVLLDRLVKPKGRIPREATAVHGIAQRDVEGSATWPEVRGAVEAIVAGRPVITYNAEFDLRLLAQTCKAWGQPAIAVEAHCAMLAYARLRAVPHPYRDGDFKWHRLDDACRHEGLDLPQGHRALGDARMARALVLAMAARKRAGGKPQA